MMEDWKMENRRKIHEILDAVLDTNDLEARTREKTGTLPTVFLSFSGHVALLDVNIHKNGWKANIGHDMDFGFYVDREMDDKKIEKLKAYLQDVNNESDEEDVLKRDIEELERQLDEMRSRLKEVKGAEAHTKTKG